MKTFARITAVILIIFGILVMLGGLTMGVIGIVRAGSRALARRRFNPDCASQAECCLAAWED